MQAVGYLRCSTEVMVLQVCPFGSTQLNLPSLPRMSLSTESGALPSHIRVSWGLLLAVLPDAFSMLPPVGAFLSP